MSSGRDWGEEVADKGKKVVPMEEPDIPEPEVIIADGVKKVITYSLTADNRVQKKTKTFQIETRKTQVNADVARRRKLAKFGKERGRAAGPDPRTTTVAEEVFLTLSRPKDQSEAKVEVTAEDLLKPKEIKCRTCQGDHLTHKCPYKSSMATLQQEATAAEDEEEQPANTGRYVAPRRTESDRPEGFSVRVNNLADDVREDELRELFRPFGSVNRVSLPMETRADGSQRCRGFAFVSFYTKDVAQKAIDKLNGYGFHHLILRVDWSKPAGERS